MENTGTSPLLRSRRLGSFLSTSSGPGVRGTPKIPVKKVGQTLRHDVCVGGDGWGSTLISCVRMATCFITVMVLTVIWAVIMIVLIPWPYERIKQGNVYGHVTGRLMMWILGNHVTIEGAKFSNKRAIYICNHASLLDVFLVMWLTPTGSVGIAKKKVKRWTTAPLQKGLCSSGIANRSPNSSHGPLTGTHQARRKGSLHVRPASLSVKYLPPIKTDGWTADKIDEHIKMVHDLYVHYTFHSYRSLLC